ncbi:hypothetical protein [Pyxidicoccus caerfyrddinensis]|uniref:hypothetical protein n=1 Tax=Pyxidicoccus caerfyrddinensis TaxID=2709663 RepID=UPI0013DA5A17|nr:hypothetical protein [Pyxidicoccus caerfyrddinensis]
MKTNIMIVGAMLCAGLVSAGCGGPEVDAEVSTEAELESREDALPDCGGREYEITYYAEPEHLTYVGNIVCTCNSSGSQVFGSRSPYFERWDGALCSI